MAFRRGLPLYPQSTQALEAAGGARDTSVKNMLAAYFGGAGGRVLGSLGTAEEVTRRRIADALGAETKARVQQDAQGWIDRENEKRAGINALTQNLVDVGGKVAGGVIAASETEEDRARDVPKRKTDRQIAAEDIAEVEAINRNVAYRRALDEAAEGLPEGPFPPPLPTEGEVVLPGYTTTRRYGGRRQDARSLFPGIRGGRGTLTATREVAPLRIDLTERGPTAQDLIAEYAARNAEARAERREGRVVGRVDALDPTRPSAEELRAVAESMASAPAPAPVEDARGVQEARRRGLAGQEGQDVVRNPEGGDPYEYAKRGGVWYYRRAGAAQGFIPVHKDPVLLQRLDSWLVGGR